MKLDITEILIHRGPNRHYTNTVFELTFESGQTTTAILRSDYVVEQLCLILGKYGIQARHEIYDLCHVPSRIEEENPFQILVRCFCGLTIFFQRMGQHPVDWFIVNFAEPKNQAKVCFEYDDDAVAFEATHLALRVLQSLPQLGDGLRIYIEGSELQQSTSNFEEQLSVYMALARSKALPDDTLRLIQLAQQRGIPYAKGDRYPFRPLNKFRIRPNGGLRLGYGANQHVLDGCMCLDLGGHAIGLWNNAIETRRFLTRLGIPIPKCDPETENCNSLLRAKRSANRLGYPVTITSNHSVDGGLPRLVRSDQELNDAVRELQKYSQRLVVEKYVEGSIYHLIFVNNHLEEVVEAIPSLAGFRHIKMIHPDYLGWGSEIANELRIGIFQVTVASSDISLSPKLGHGVIIDVCVAPRIDSLINDHAARNRILGEYLTWLYPLNRLARIPIVAVTGTNGKTTTSRMINSILVQAGFTTGLACTDGVYIAGQLVERGDSSGFLFHHQVLQDLRVSHAVLETARGAVLHTGFAYDACDVAVCTNVTDDHLGEFGVNSRDQMADLKLSIIKRAKSGVVLNADDQYSRYMFTALDVPKIGLISLRKTVHELKKWDSGVRVILFCVLEPLNGKDWLVLYDGFDRHPIIDVNEIPATHNGSAKHNILNALQAIVASCMVGVSISNIRFALNKFEATYANAPGRLNIVRSIPFRVVIDYAHNVDGYRVLTDFMDNQTCAGKKIILVGLPGRSTADAINEIASHIAGHFNQYICRDSRKLKGYEPGALPKVMKDALVNEGVCESDINIVPIEMDAVAFALSIAEPDDWVILCLTSSSRDQAYKLILEVEQSCK